jgi:hypothetical protein
MMAVHMTTETGRALVRPATLVRKAGSVLTARRHRLPARLDRAIDRAKWARAPWTADPPGLPPVTTTTGERARVLVAPANFAGQGRAWTDALVAAGVPAVCWAYVADGRFGFGADHVAGIATVSRASARYQRAVFERVAGGFEAVVIEAGRPLFGRLFGYDPLAEARALRAAGVRVALLWHGTDIRDPGRHAATHPRSPYRDADHRARTSAIQAVARRNRARLAAFDGPVLVSTPDLLGEVPGATWCPVVVDLARWRAGRPAFADGVPLVAHVPSNPWLKGGDLVAPAVTALAERGVLRWEARSGLTSDEVRDLYLEADVVLDQFRLGIYGVAACEAMAAGRVVVSDVDAAVRAVVEDRTDRAFPVVQAEPGTVADVLVGLVEDRDRARAVAAEGVAFVADVHDGRRSAAALCAALGLAP